SCRRRAWPGPHREARPRYLRGPPLSNLQLFAEQLGPGCSDPMPRLGQRLQEGSVIGTAARVREHRRRSLGRVVELRCEQARGDEQAAEQGLMTGERRGQEAPGGEVADRFAERWTEGDALAQLQEVDDEL